MIRSSGDTPELVGTIGGSDLFKSLIAFDTTSYRSNLALIDYVRDYLSQYGVKSKLFFSDERNKANLYATIGPDDRPGIVLSGHTDVVPVTGQDWQYDPWRATESNSRIYGRGVCDMKGFISVVLSRVPAMAAAELQRPIHIALSYDEEIGCVGVRSLLAYLATLDVKPAACIVGEPTNMQIVSGHKGKLSVHCQVRGYACHSALAPRGVNAVEAAAKLVAFLSEMAERCRSEGPIDHGFDVPYTTIHTGLIRGGTVLNIVPGECEFEFEFRHLPADDPDDRYSAVKAFARSCLEPAMQAVRPETGFVFAQRSRFAGLDTDPGAEIIALLKRLTGERRVGKVGFGTEGGEFDAIGIPAVVCGPGSIQQAHRPDEFVTLEQLERCEILIDRLVEELSNA